MSAFQFARDNPTVVLFQSALASGANNSPDQQALGRGARLMLDITAVSGVAPTLDVKLQSKDPASGKYLDIPGAVFTQKNGVSTDDLTIYPGIAETANETVSDTLSRVWRAVGTVRGSSTPTVTCTLSASYIP